VPVPLLIPPYKISKISEYRAGEPSAGRQKYSGSGNCLFKGKGPRKIGDIITLNDRLGPN
jgi:hypothetical protein